MVEPPVQPNSRHLSPRVVIAFWILLAAAIVVPVSLALADIDLTRYRLYYIIKAGLQLAIGLAAAVVSALYALRYWRMRHATPDGGRNVVLAACTAGMSVIILGLLSIPLSTLLHLPTKPTLSPLIRPPAILPATRTTRPTTRRAPRVERPWTRPASTRPATRPSRSF